MLYALLFLLIKLKVDSVMLFICCHFCYVRSVLKCHVHYTCFYFLLIVKPLIDDLFVMLIFL